MAAPNNPALASQAAKHELDAQVTRVDVVSRKCDHPDGCSKLPRFGIPGSKTRTRCAPHKEDGMVDVVSRKCDHPDGCSKLPSFGIPGSKIPTRCAAHKEEGMAYNVISRKCDHPDGCSTRPSFCIPGSQIPTRCAVHMEAGMVGSYSLHTMCYHPDGLHTMCYHPDGCNKAPSYGLLNSNKATRCAAHRDADMVHIKEIRKRKRGEN